MPDGSRQSTSPEVGFGDPVGRQVEDRRRVDGHLEQRPQVAELEAAVDQDGALLQLGERDGEVERDRRLADAALGREDADQTAVVPVAWRASKSLRTWAIRVIRSKPENGIDSTPWMPTLGVRLDRVLRHGQDDDRDAELGLVDLLDELGALDPALEQRVDEDDVRAQLADRRDRPGRRRSGRRAA